MPQWIQYLSVAWVAILLIATIVLASVVTHLRAQLTVLISENVKIKAESTRLAEAAQQVEHWRAEATDQERRRGEVVDTIVTVQKERDKWKDLYMTCGVQHGNAQELLFAELGRVYKVCKAHRINIKESQQVRTVVEEFARLHTTPLREGLGGTVGATVDNVQPAATAAGNAGIPAAGVTKTLDLPAETLAGSSRG